MSMAMITFLEPDVAVTYHGLTRGSKSLVQIPYVPICWLPG